MVTNRALLILTLLLFAVATLVVLVNIYFQTEPFRQILGIAFYALAFICSAILLDRLFRQEYEEKRAQRKQTKVEEGRC